MKLGKLHIRAHHLPHIGAGLFALVMLLGMAGPFADTGRAHADLLPTRYFKLSDSLAGATNVSYMFGFTIATPGPLGSIRFQICSNYIYDPSTDVCNTPTGFDISGAVLNQQDGATNFTMDPPIDGNTLLIRRPTATAVASQPLTYEFSGLQNPSNIGTMYVRVATYASTDGSGPETDYGNAVAVIVNSIEVDTEVPPYLYFCTGLTIATLNCNSAVGDFISFGELSIQVPRTGTSQMLAATNAPSGYSVTLAGSTLTAGNNVIPAMTGGGSAAGTSQFGMNAIANSGPAVGNNPDGPGTVVPMASYATPNNFRFVSGDIITTVDHSDDYRRTTISYIVNRSKGQAAGRYVATVSYICLANF